MVAKLLVLKLLSFDFFHCDLSMRGQDAAAGQEKERGFAGAVLSEKRINAMVQRDIQSVENQVFRLGIVVGDVFEGYLMHWNPLVDHTTICRKTVKLSDWELEDTRPQRTETEV